MHTIGYFLTDGFQVMALGTQSVFEFANVVAREQVYQVTNYSLSGGVVVSSIGASVNTQPVTPESRADTWMVSGIVDPIGHVSTAEELGFIQRAAGQAQRVGGMCTGAFVLAEAGLLDGKKVTTHWAYASVLKERFPLTLVEADSIFINDGAIWTSAGLSAAMDLALGMVEKDLGHEIANKVARVLVMYHRRSGGQSQHSEMLNIAPKSDRVQAALDYARSHLKDDLSAEALARTVHLSERQFRRVFLSETGLSPAKAVEQLRLETARNMLQRSQHSLEIIARETGFRDRRHLREVFIRKLGVSPQSFRREAREGENESVSDASSVSGS
ncbi:GlxA family transcriptional regulator [Pseudomonas sp. GD03842]|uniref:GlxA family transcriptional regulator n=1 Tax=unclassified Pseudomonas TaxID=196821 RepID=UPI000D38F708|nr:MULTISPECIES: GlxA family transcriptional regulator [unclassified Pseudomonas]MDH0748892.1 GlxA family transcriptional regulator [Pseudomonas sp. GD03842]RAU44118.1 GlxA family transcriptional regulator [Pseudomonas sp. RIT 409]RAU54863.1 GlxA family transcriptional regulator [Pseudomonas sp. RIT 412]